MTKFITVIFAAFISISSLAQNDLQSVKTAAANFFAQPSFFPTLKKNIDGSIHLYKDWNNVGIIYTSDGQKIILENVNFNIIDDVFQSKISKDSLFSFKLVKLDRVILNRKVYKNLYANGSNKIYEVIYESNKIAAYKKYDIEIIEASNHPMDNRPRSKYSQKASYFFKRSNDFIPFRLSKKSVLKLFNDKEQVTKVQTFVKENKLSYKKEKDINKIFIYYDSL